MQGVVNSNAQRFHRILVKGLKVGVETNIAKSEFSGMNLPPGFQVKDAGDRVYVRHPAHDNGVDLYQTLLINPQDAQPHILSFQPLPKGANILFQRLNFVQLPNPRVLGVALGRFTVSESHPETAPFTIMRAPLKEGYVNLDCLSRSPAWNPLFVKYRLSVISSLKENEFGYLRIDVARNKNQEIVVTTTRVLAHEVPEFLKTAATFPQ